MTNLIVKFSMKEVWSKQTKHHAIWPKSKWKQIRKDGLNTTVVPKGLSTQSK